MLTVHNDVQRIRLSSTTLESWRLVLTADFKDKDEFVRELTGEFLGNRYTQLGTAFHTLLEEWEERDTSKLGDYVTQDGLTFYKADIEQATLYLPPKTGRLWEVKKVIEVEVDNLVVEVVAKVDILSGNHIYDNKTKWSQFAIDSYLDSLQWRIYLDAWQADKFTYNVFAMRDMEGRQGVDAKLLDVHQFSQYRYPTIRHDWYAYLVDCVRFLRRSGLLDHERLAPKFDTEMAL